MEQTLKRIGQRLSSRQGRKQAERVWASAYILLGLRYSPVLAAQLFRGVLSMKESSTYQAILEEGAVAEARKLLRAFGERAYGAPDARTAAIIEGIDDLARLEELCNQLPVSESWQQLLGQPPASPRGRRGRRSS